MESYQTQCTMPSYPFSQTLCIVIQGGNEPQLVTGIGDFDYEWGYRYELIIKETESDPNLQDAPPVLRDLVEVVSKEKVAPGTTFETRLETVFPARGASRRQIITQEAPNLFAFFGQYGDDFGREFTCDPALCEEFNSLMKQDLELVIKFAHPENPDDPLVAQRIVSTKALPNGY